MSTEKAIQAVVEARIKEILEHHQAWPKNLLQLSLECQAWEKSDKDASIGIYQNRTNNIIRRMSRAGEVSIFKVEYNGSERPFIGKQGCDSVSDEVWEHYTAFNKFIDQNGHFAALMAFVATCKLVDELNNVVINVYPEGNYSVIPHTDREPDLLLEYQDEWVPIEVYNGIDQLDIESEDYSNKKYRQLRDHADVPEGYQLNCNPFLINRRSTDDLKKQVKHWDGMVIDTDQLLANKEDEDEYKDVLKFFEIEESVTFLSPIKSPDGTEIDGEVYDDSSPSSPLFRPISALASEAAEIPEQYLKRIRGGIQLHYVNSIYRRRQDVTQPYTAMVLQNLYKQLLKEGGKTKSDAIDAGWAEANIRDAVPQIQRQSISKNVEKRVEELIDQNLVWRQNGQIYARKAAFPKLGLVYET